MIQLFGWAAIRENYTVDNEDENIESIENELRERIKNFGWLKTPGLGILELKYLNGDLILNISIKANRFRQESKDAFELFDLIAEIAKGSYGLLYFHDEEDLHGKDNTFQVYVLAKGLIKKKDDIFLSPLFPTIED